jgi:hypothetical protein
MRLNFAAKVLLPVLPVVDSSSRFFGHRRRRTKNKKRKLQKKEGALLTFSETANDSNTSYEPIESIKEHLRSKIQPAAPLILKPSKECDPTLVDNQAELDIDIDIDIGVLSSCSMDQRCVESDMSSLGGTCVDHNIRVLKEEKQSRTLQAQYDVDYFCSGTNLYFTCDCSGMDENGLGTAVCTYNALPLCVTSTATFNPDNSASIVYCYTTGHSSDAYSNVCYTRDLAADGSSSECLMVDNQSCICSPDVIIECADGYIGTSIDCTGLGVDIQGDDCEGYPYLVPATFYMPDEICNYMTTAMATATPTGSPIDPSPIVEPPTTAEGVIPTAEGDDPTTTTPAVVFTAGATYTPGITATPTDTPVGGDPTASPTDKDSGATGLRHIFVVAALGVWSLGPSFWW